MKKVIRLLYIGEASSHGKEFIEPGMEDKHFLEGIKFIRTIKKIAEKGLKIIGFPIGEHPPIHSFKKFKEIYEQNHGHGFYLYKDLMNIEYFNNITEEAIKFIIDKNFLNWENY